MFGNYELRGVCLLKGTYHKLYVYPGSNPSGFISDFGVHFEGDEEVFNIHANYGFMLGYSGEYSFTISLGDHLLPLVPGFPSTRDLQTSWDFSVNVDWDEFIAVAEDVTYGQAISPDYRNMTRDANPVEYEIAPIIDGVVGEYDLDPASTTLDVGLYSIIAKANTRIGEVTSKPGQFRVLGRSFGDQLSLNLDSLIFMYSGSKLSDYPFYAAHNGMLRLLNRGNEISGVEVRWEHPDYEIELTNALDCRLSFSETVIFHKTGYEDYKASIDVEIRLDEMRIPSVPTPYGGYVYNGQPQTVTLDGFDESYMEVVEANSTFTATDAGQYTIQVKIKDTISATFDNGSKTADIIWGINKANAASYYQFSDSSLTYRLELEDAEDGALYEGDYADGVFYLPCEPMPHKGYLRLYRGNEESEKLVEVDGIDVTTPGSLTDYGYEEGKGVYFQADTFAFAFSGYLLFGQTENSNFNNTGTRITFNAYVNMPDEKTILFDHDHHGVYAQDIKMYCTVPMNQPESGDNYCLVEATSEDRIGFTVGCWFEEVTAIEVSFAAPNFSPQGRFEIYLGNNREYVENYQTWLIPSLISGDTRIGTYSLEGNEEKTFRIEDPELLSCKGSPCLVKFSFPGGYSNPSESYHAIKEIKVECRGSLEYITR